VTVTPEHDHRGWEDGDAGNITDFEEDEVLEINYNVKRS